MLRAGNLNFSKGELAEELIARVDVPSYNAGTKRARNVLVLKYGGLTKRPGTHFIAEALQGDNPVRLIPFQFSLTQAYALEFGQGYMRPAANGGLILETKIKVTALSKDTNAQVRAAFHGYSVGQQVYFSGITGMTEINGRFGIVQLVIDQDNFTVNIDTRSFGIFTGSDGSVNTAPPPPPPAPTVPDPTPPPPDPPTTGGGGEYRDGDVTRLLRAGQFQ